MIFPKIWDELTCINYLQRKIIITSIIYYEMDNNMMSDRDYDLMCKQCCEMMKSCSEVESSQYYYIFYDFDGTTGFHLKDRLNEKDKKYLYHLANLFNDKKPVKKQEKKIKKKGKLF